MNGTSQEQAPPAETPRGYLTVRRAMEIANCSESTVWRLIRNRQVGVQRVRSRVVIREADLRIWLKPRTYLPERGAAIRAAKKRSALLAAPTPAPADQQVSSVVTGTGDAR